jgi:type II secretory pathway component PulM
MIEKFRQLAPREQIIVGLGIVLAVLIIGWRFVWTPLSDGSAELRDSVAAKSRLMIDLQRAAGLAPATQASASSSGEQPVYLLAPQTAASYGLRFTQTRPDGANVARISFRDVSFDQLMAWLTALDAQYGIAVASGASFSGSGQPGLVTGQLALQRLP